MGVFVLCWVDGVGGVGGLVCFGRGVVATRVVYICILRARTMYA
jgi:hypothetical protein